jgi:hypothetical protein
MKKPWRDGTLALVFEPQDLFARLCAMVPPPRWHLIRFHGVLSAHAALRPEVIPSAAVDENDPATCAGAQLELFPSAAVTAGNDDATSDGDRQPREPSRKPWAWLLRRVFAADLQTCEHCGGRMRWKEVVTTASRICAFGCPCRISWKIRRSRRRPSAWPGPLASPESAAHKLSARPEICAASVSDAARGDQYGHVGGSRDQAAALPIHHDERARGCLSRRLRTCQGSPGRRHG